MARTPYRDEEAEQLDYEIKRDTSKPTHQINSQMPVEVSRNDGYMGNSSDYYTDAGDKDKSGLKRMYKKRDE